MSREQLVRRTAEAFEAGDDEVVRDLYHPDVVMHHLEGWPEPGPSVGREAVMREFRQIREAQEMQSLDVTDFVELGDRAAVRYHWRGSGSGPDLDMEFTFVLTFRDEKVIFLENFWDHDEALRVLGVRK